MKRTKKQTGITLIALVVTIVILLILAGITIGTLTGENGLLKSTLSAKEKSEIANEKEIVDIATVQAMKKDRFGEVKKVELQNQLDNNTGTGKTTVTEEIEDKVLLAKFIASQRIYEVDEDGNVTYLGNETDLLSQANISANPPTNTTPQLTQVVELTVKTPLSIEDTDISLVYAWNQSESEGPDRANYVKATNLTGTGRTKKTTVNSNDTAAGNYYLWAKVLVGKNEITTVFGPYAIKDHTTLIACNTETQASSGFLGNTNISRNMIQKVTIATSFGAHSLSDENCWDVSQSQDGKYVAWYETNEDGYYEVTIAGNGGVVANSNSRHLFANVGYEVEGTEIVGIENLDTGLVTDMSYMFYYANKITALDLSTFDTSNVTDMSAMFRECRDLTKLDIKNFETSNVTSMWYMFFACNSLTSLDVSNFNTSNITDMTNMFNGCNKLTKLDISHFTTYKVTSMEGMFNGCSSLTSLDVSNFDTNNVAKMSYMFQGCSNLTKLEVNRFNTSNVKNMEWMFNGCSLTSLDVSNFDTSNVTNMSRMFSGCRNLTSLNVSKFDTSNVRNMGWMFNDCNSLTSLDVSNFDTSNVTDMQSMFSSCSSLTSLDLSNFNTSKVTGMRTMFAGCSSLISLDVSNFSTSNIVSMQAMFYNCNSLTSLDVSNFNTSKVTTMSEMFRECSKLTSLDLSNFDTSRVTSMSSMFNACFALTSLSLSNFNTSNVTNMDYMIYNCRKLANLNIKSFDMTNVTSYINMISVPTTVSITTNSTMASWLNEKFPSYTNITIVDE